MRYTFNICGHFILQFIIFKKVKKRLAIIFGL